METKLGWTVIGKVNDLEENLASTVTSMHVRSSDVSELWKLETIGISDTIELNTKNEADDIAKKYFLETNRRDPEGRYEVSLPWINGEKLLPSNRAIAEKRLISST